jgi:hypothetical protein
LVRKSCKELCLEKNTQMSFSSSCWSKDTSAAKHSDIGKRTGKMELSSLRS